MRILILSVLLLGGCRHVARVELVPVYTPVPTPVSIPHYERPQLTINRLTEAQKTEDGEIAKAYVATLLELIHYAQSLESILQNVKDQDETEFVEHEQ